MACQSPESVFLSPTPCFEEQRPRSVISNAGEARLTNDVMSLQRRKFVRPLGHIHRDSRLEIQMEKALFRTNIKLLSDIISVKRSTPRSMASTLPMTSYGMPTFRHILSFGDKDRLVNNAEHAKYHNYFSNRVGSEDVRRKGSGIYGGNNSVCSRRYEGTSDVKKMKSAQCDVLGPDFCTDCSRLQRRIKSAQHSKQNFPNIDVHSNSLIAPRKLESLLLSEDNSAMSKRNNALSTVYYDLANIYSGMSKSQVYTETEVYDRVRSAKRQEMNKELEVYTEREPTVESEMVAPPCSRENSDLQELPMPNNMRVTVSFSV
ncbi:hypothetical protein FSP39_017316 [Pinctada imbricata]|uniref:Uncharacterized protein n=1 Tax=Pinctada imbricata TaxID=66713 RepID=A0AA89BVZ2_PINIB|nr:hypothetical protein FSP39_017316 [Pinctada imbricata]